MAQTFEKILDELIPWIEAQPVFFVATAPADPATINVSPRGLDTFRVLDAKRVAWLDLTGKAWRGNDSPHQSGRPHHADVLRLRRPAADTAPLLAAARSTGLRTRRTTLCVPTCPTCPGRGPSCRRRGGASVELLRVRGAAHGLCGSPRTARRIGPAQGEADGGIPGGQNAASIDGLPGLQPILVLGGRRERSKRGLDVTVGRLRRKQSSAEVVFAGGGCWPRRWQGRSPSASSTIS